MTTGYVAIDVETFKNVIEKNMGFTEIKMDGTTERVWERFIPKTNFSVRVYSSIVCRKSRGVGEDAIRVMLFDVVKERPVAVEKRVNRTMNAIPNMRERARDLWKYAIDKNNYCPDCGDILVPRKGKFGEFKGCNSFPTCKHVKK